MWMCLFLGAQSLPFSPYVKCLPVTVFFGAISKSKRLNLCRFRVFLFQSLYLPFRSLRFGSSCCPTQLLCEPTDSLSSASKHCILTTACRERAHTRGPEGGCKISWELEFQPFVAIVKKQISKMSTL